MIDTLNNLLSLQQRKQILARALYTNPYFYKLNFDISSGVASSTEFGSNVGINRDFFLTEMLGNFCDAFTTTGSLFNVSVYTAFLHSIYGYVPSTLLPVGFVMNDARFRTPIINEIYVDRQFEIPPVLIKNNDKIFVDIRNLDAKVAGADITIVLKGFNVIKDAFLSETETEKINRSLQGNADIEFFEITVDQQGINQIAKANDNFPRLILGFGITNESENKSQATQCTVTIKDTSRKVSLTDTAIPVEFIAPRMTCLQDAHLYTLPIEYYWQPFGNLEFTFNNNQTGTDDGFKFVIMTRKV
jgi:hypothetical protein